MHVGFVVLLVFVVSCTCSNYRACLEHMCLFLIEARWPQSFWPFVFTKSYTICHICLLNPAFLFCTLYYQSPKATVDNPLIGYHSQHIHTPIIWIQNIAGKNRWGTTKESNRHADVRINWILQKPWLLLWSLYAGRVVKLSLSAHTYVYVKIILGDSLNKKKRW